MASNTGSKPARWKDRFIHELIEYWMTVIYLSLYFGVFTIYRRLILAHYQISYLNYGFAIIEALILAKVILVGDLVRLGRGLENRPLIIPTIFRSLLFTVWVGLYLIIEHVIKAAWQGEGAIAGLENFLSKGKYELLASSLVVLFTFIPFFAFKELSRALGKGKILQLFFRGPAKTESTSGTGPSSDQTVLP